MESLDWVEEFPGALTVCDTRGTILSMNEQAAAVYQGSGDRRLIGTNLLARVADPRPMSIPLKKRPPSTHLHPLVQDGRYAGFMELAWKSRRAFEEIRLLTYGLERH